MKKYFSICILIFLIFISFSCNKKSTEVKNSVIIGIPSDITTFNPMFAFNYSEGNISELIYLGLVEHRWSDEQSKLVSQPLLAETLEWSEDSLSISIKLREDILWSDSSKFNVDDVVFSLRLYSDATVQSKFYGSFGNYFTNDDLSIDAKKSFEIISPYELKINFNKNAVPSLFDIDFPIIPKHIFAKIPIENLATAEENLNPIGTGPFRLGSWNKNQAIILKSNQSSILYNEEMLSELIFKIVPDYNSTVNQLKSGELDFAEELNPADVNELQNNYNLKIEFQKGREYEYIGWNNLDPEIFEKNQKVSPHKLFGNSRVRNALSLAINRKLILEEYLSNYGKLAVGPIAPIFKNTINQELQPIPFDPQKAKEILAEEGWTDKNLDGIIDKNGIGFTFTLRYPGDNPLREYSSTIIKENLKNVGIEVSTESIEPQVFWDGLFSKKYDAWIAGWLVPIPIYLKPFWHSNLEANVPNLVSYQNEDADILLDKMETKISPDNLNTVYKEFQSKIYNDNPVTFMFWKHNIVAYNRKIEGVKISPLGVIHKSWNWSVSE